MNWDELQEKFTKINEENPDGLKAIVKEFGSLKNLAFGILEAVLSDVHKYGTICAYFGDAKSAHRVADAGLLYRKLVTLKEEFNKL